MFSNIDATVAPALARLLELFEQIKANIEAFFATICDFFKGNIGSEGADGTV